MGLKEKASWLLNLNPSAMSTSHPCHVCPWTIVSTNKMVNKRIYLRSKNIKLVLSLFFICAHIIKMLLRVYNTINHIKYDNMCTAYNTWIISKKCCIWKDTWKFNWPDKVQVGLFLQILIIQELHLQSGAKWGILHILAN